MTIMKPFSSSRSVSHVECMCGEVCRLRALHCTGACLHQNFRFRRSLPTPSLTGECRDGSSLGSAAGYDGYEDCDYEVVLGV